jgi:allantoicase
MTTKQQSIKRAVELEELLTSANLNADQRHAYEQELNSIVDNMAEGCYSDDPDDGVDWSMCPGIH